MVDSMTAGHPDPVVAKQASAPTLDSFYEVSVLMCCVWFSPNVQHELWPKDIVPQVLRFVQMQRYNS